MSRTMLKSDAAMMLLAEKDAHARTAAAASAMLQALKGMQAALTEYGLRDVKKRFSLCVADAAASKAIAAAEAAGIQEGR